MALSPELFRSIAQVFGSRTRGVPAAEGGSLITESSDTGVSVELVERRMPAPIALLEERPVPIRLVVAGAPSPQLERAAAKWAVLVLLLSLALAVIVAISSAAVYIMAVALAVMASAIAALAAALIALGMAMLWGAGGALALWVVYVIVRSSRKQR